MNIHQFRFVAARTGFAIALCALVAGPAIAQSKPRPNTSMVELAEKPKAPESRGTMVARNASVADRVSRLESWSAALKKDAARPLPEGLTPAERAEAERYVRWLRTSANRMDRLAARGREALKGAPSPSSRDSLNDSFNMDYLNLQSEMQEQNRRYAMIASIMKTKHDTTKNTISNVR